MKSHKLRPSRPSRSAAVPVVAVSAETETVAAAAPVGELWRLHAGAVSADQQIFIAVAGLTGLSRAQARKAVMGGLVRVDGSVVIEPNATMSGACRVDLRHGVDAAFKAARHGTLAPTEKKLTVLFRDSWLAVVDKAPGVLSAPTVRVGSNNAEKERGHVPELLRRMLRKQGREPTYIGVVHRLDLDTSGCLCFALSKEAQRLINAQFAGDAAGRIYRVLIQGHPIRDEGELRGRTDRGPDGRRRFMPTVAARSSDDHDDESGVEAITRYRVLRRFAMGCELEVSLGTGRTHQIRTSMAAMGWSVYGDRLYGRRSPTGAPVAPRLMLHAWRLELDHPGTGARLVVEAPIPTAFTAFAKQLDRKQAPLLRPTDGAARAGAGFKAPGALPRTHGDMPKTSGDTPKTSGDTPKTYGMPKTSGAGEADARGPRSRSRPRAR